MDGGGASMSDLLRQRWDVNFHGPTVEALTSFMAARCQNRQSEAYVALVTGPPGCGKSFSVAAAIRRAGLEVVHIDMLAEDSRAHVKQALVGSGSGGGGRAPGQPPPVFAIPKAGSGGRTGRRVVVIETVDHVDVELLRSVVGSLEHFVHPHRFHGRRKGGGRAAGVEFWVNPVVMTCTSKHAAAVYRSQLCTKLKCLEISCEAPAPPQRAKLVRLGCELRGIEASPLLLRVAAGSPDLNSVCNQVEFTAASARSPYHAENHRVDDAEPNVFEGVKYLLEPSKRPPPPWGGRSPEGKYLWTWERLGPRVPWIVFNTYPGRIPSVPHPRGGCRNAEDLRTHVARFGVGPLCADMDQAWEVADAFSLYDATPDPGVGRPLLALRSRAVFTRMGPKRGGVQVKLPRGGGAYAERNPAFEHRCLIGRREVETFRAVTEMYQSQLTSLASGDRSEAISADYQLSRHVGVFRSLRSSKEAIRRWSDDPEGNPLQYEDVDMFQNPGEVNEAKTSAHHPRMDMIRRFSHVFKTGVQLKGTPLVCFPVGWGARPPPTPTPPLLPPNPREGLDS